jgi:hypothetical protein
MSDICSLIGCNNEVYQNAKCIFHCEKNDWLEKNSNGLNDWSKSSDKIARFWKEIRELKIQKEDFDFRDFIFPIFENMNLDYDNNYDFNEGNTKGKKVKYYNLRYEDGSISQSFWSQNQKLLFRKKVNFSGSTFKDKAYLGYICYSDGVNFNNVIFEDEAYFVCSYFYNNVTFYNTHFKTVHFDYSFFNSELFFQNIQIKNATFYKTIFHGYTRFKVIEVKGISTLTFDKTEINNDFSIENIRDDRNLIIIFNGTIFNEESDTYFNKIKIGSIILRNILNDSNFFTFSNIEIIKNLVIRDCNVSDIEFYNCNFESEKINIGNVSFISNNGFTIFNGVKWGDIRKTFDKTIDRDTFRQLKYVNEQQGNIIEANKFYSAEMKAYKEELKDKKNKHRWQDRVIFWLNEKVSNFSQSWILPLAWYCIFGFLFAFIYYFNSSIFLFQGFISTMLLFLSIILFVLDFKKSKDFKRNLNLLFVTSGLNYFMNVTSESLTKLFKFINPFNTSGLIDNEPQLIWWILFRIISIFIIYQFIISLRRQTRR